MKTSDDTELLTEEIGRLRGVISRLRCEECGDELGNEWDDDSGSILCGYCKIKKEAIEWQLN